MSKKIRFTINEEIPEYYKANVISDNETGKISIGEEPLYPSYKIYDNKKVYSREKLNQLPWNEECKEKCNFNVFDQTNRLYLDCFDNCISKREKNINKINIEKITVNNQLDIEDELKNPDFMLEIIRIGNTLRDFGYPNIDEVNNKLIKIRRENDHWEFYFISINSILKKLIERYSSTKTFGLMKNKQRLHRRIAKLFEILDNLNFQDFDEDKIYNDLLTIKGGKTIKRKRKNNKTKKLKNNKTTKRKNNKTDLFS